MGIVGLVRELIVAGTTRRNPVFKAVVGQLFKKWGDHCSVVLLYFEHVFEDALFHRHESGCALSVFQDVILLFYAQAHPNQPGGQGGFIQSLPFTCQDSRLLFRLMFGGAGLSPF